MELHSAAILEVWLRQSASWPRSICGATPSAVAAAAAGWPTAAAAAASARLRRPIYACARLGRARDAASSQGGRSGLEKGEARSAWEVGRWEARWAPPGAVQG